MTRTICIEIKKKENTQHNIKVTLTQLSSCYLSQTFYHLVDINIMFSSIVLASREITKNKTEIQKTCPHVAYWLTFFAFLLSQ